METLSEYISRLNSYTSSELLTESPKDFHVITANDSIQGAITKMLANDAILWKKVVEFNQNLYARKVNAVSSKHSITFQPVQLDPAYIKEWQVSTSDYLQIYKDGKLLRPTLYRFGGMNGQWKDGFIMVFKCEESHYPKEIMEMSESYYKKEGLEHRSNHLSNDSCIIDENGDERFVSNSSSAYLHKGGIYSVSQKYYNARNNELYCDSSKTITTENFTFLHNQWDEDKTRRGVLKINHANGLYEIIN